MTTTAATADSSIEEEIVKEKNLLLLERKIAIATQGFTDYFINKLRRQSEQNTTIICDYILAMNVEVNPVLANKQNQTQILCYLSEFCNQKAFINMTRKDVVSYLDSLRKPEDSDPSTNGLAPIIYAVYTFYDSLSGYTIHLWNPKRDSSLMYCRMFRN